MAEPLLELRQVCKYYTGNQAVVVGLNNISLLFSRGEFVAVTGESGSGKSTLSHVVGGILPYESGELYFKGAETSHFDSLEWERYRRDNISFISQNYGILPSATVMKNVVSALILAGMDKSEAKTSAEKILRQVELWDMRRRRAAKLSSGQKQRLSIARALAKPAPILIADEPTGNLDPENSAKIISLLAEASKDRLVLLITHEFDEAKDLATRHIVLQDGKIASDTELRPAPQPGPMPSVNKGKKRPLSPYVARLQYSSRPVWTTIMMCLFALTAFTVFAFLGVFVISLDDTSTRIYDNSAFRNGSPDRIAVMRGDLGTFTDEDYREILSISHVNAIEPFGYVSDVQYAYREGVDYVAKHMAVEYLMLSGEYVRIGNGVGSETTVISPYIMATYQFTDNAPFVRTIPKLHDGEKFLTDGRLPENFYEVVAADDKLKIGDTVKVYFSDFKNWNYASRLDVEVTVVGKTELGAGLFFHEDVGLVLRSVLQSTKDIKPYSYMPALDLEEGRFRKTPKSSIMDREYSFQTSRPSSSQFAVDDGQKLVLTLDSYLESPLSPEPELTAMEYLYNVWDRANGMTLEEAMEFFPSPRPGDGSIWSPTMYMERLVQVSYTDFFDLVDNSGSDQIDLTIEGYAYTERVIDALNDRGYAAVSPYQLGSTEQIPERVAERTQTLRVCLAALAVVIVLQILLLRAMFGLQTESYKLLSNIGLVSSSAKLSIVWQMVVFTVAGQLLGGVGIFISAAAGIERIKELLSYLPVKYILLLSGVHMFASALAAIWIILALGRQVYPLSGKDEDIVLDDGQKGE